VLWGTSAVPAPAVSIGQGPCWVNPPGVGGCPLDNGLDRVLKSRLERLGFTLLGGSKRDGHRMNKDIFEGKWKEMRGQVREWWGKLSDDDLERAGGKADQLIGLLQQKYGYTREQAEEEFNRRLKEAKDG
jgi:uncharacterized protein YjbJ (UPF0337 family)